MINHVALLIAAIAGLITAITGFVVVLRKVNAIEVHVNGNLKRLVDILEKEVKDES